ncbi:MAG TPA: hypothetical protein VF307_07820 [Candidatus Nanopelagicaceae bacterium]
MSVGVSQAVLYFDEEKRVVHRHSRNHSHFKWHLGLDALLTSIVVVGVMALVSTHSSSSRVTQLQHSGVVAMSTSDFIQHVKEYQIKADWLGPISGYKYTHIDNSLGVVSVTYWPEGSGITEVNRSALTVTTYENQGVYQTNMHPLEDPNTATIVSSSGATVKFSEASLDYEIVTFKNSPEIDVVSYPTSQLATTLMKHAEALKPVS